MDIPLPSAGHDAIRAFLSTASDAQCREFRDRLRAAGSPIHDPDRGTAVFLWEGDVLSEAADHAVYLWINRVTDRADFSAGMMQPIPGSRWWSAEVPIAPSARHSYGFLQVPRDCPGLDGPPPLGPGGFRLDPVNRHCPVLDFGDGCGASLACGADADPHPDWDTPAGASSARGTVRTRHDWSVAGQQRSTYLYVPPSRRESSAPVPLVVLLDGEQWFDRAGLADAFDAGIARGAMGPVAVLGISAAHDVPRLADMCRCDEILEFTLEHALGWAAELLAAAGLETAAGPAGRAITGASLGGYIALAAAVRSPGHFGAVLAQSPSLWASPHGGSPRDLATMDGPGWLADQFTHSPPQPSPQIRMSVGSRESESLPIAEAFHDLSVRAGWEIAFETRAGGHDIAWWREELSEFTAWLSRETQAAVMNPTRGRGTLYR